MGSENRGVFERKSTALVQICTHLLEGVRNRKYNPSDARFLGSPVDFIVFDGLSDGELRELVIVEVKTGSGILTTRERAVARAIEEGRIRFEILRKE